jgi:hypothetical protein
MLNRTQHDPPLHHQQQKMSCQTVQDPRNAHIVRSNRCPRKPKRTRPIVIQKCASSSAPCRHNSTTTAAHTSLHYPNNVKEQRYQRAERHPIARLPTGPTRGQSENAMGWPLAPKASGTFQSYHRELGSSSPSGRFFSFCGFCPAACWPVPPFAIINMRATRSVNGVQRNGCLCGICRR